MPDSPPPEHHLPSERRRPGDRQPGGRTPPVSLPPRLRGPRGRRLRVAHLTTADASLHLLLATELRVDLEAGFETYGISAPGPYVPGLEMIGVRHEPLHALTRARQQPRADAAAARELLAVLNRIRPDVLHTHDPETGVLGRVLGRLARVPVVVNTCHGLRRQAHEPFAKRALVLGAEAFAARFSHAELYRNGEDRRTLSWAVPAHRSRVVGDGVDLTRFAADPRDRARIRARMRAELGVGPDELLVGGVGGVGRRVAGKGIGEFAESARALAGKARFVWIGPEDPEHPGGPDAHGTASGVEFTGPHSDLPAVYAALDVFVLPSSREGSSRSAMEAAAGGLPMVLGDVPGCREIGTHDEHLLLAPPGDARALTAALDRLLTEPGLRERLGAAARRRAAAHFDQRAVAGVSLETYAAVARARALPWTVD